MADATTSSGNGAGQQDPSDAASRYNSMLFIIRQQLAKISTMKVVLVKAVDTDAKTVDVQPMVNQLDGDDNSTPHGTILGIKYFIWQFGKNAILADPVVNDIGLMICADRDTSSVIASKAVAPPGSLRQLDAADGVYLGGILNGDPEQWVKFTDTGVELHDKNSNSLVSSNAGWAFTGPVVFNQTVDVKGVATLEGALQLGGAIEGVTGAEYGGNFATTGTVSGSDMIANPGGAQVTLRGHISTAANVPPTPGH